MRHSRSISDLRADGTLDALYRQYGLSAQEMGTN